VAQIGLVRAGQRPPDRRTAYGPPPLVKPTAPSARECRKPDGSGARSGGTVPTRATASMGNDGRRSTPGASARAEPCRAGALRARRADAWRAVPAPQAAGVPPLRAYRYRAPRVKQRLMGRPVQSPDGERSSETCSGLVEKLVM
jgi:hypothetical protein